MIRSVNSLVWRTGGKATEAAVLQTSELTKRIIGHGVKTQV